MSPATVLLCALPVLCPMREKWTKPVSALEIPASVHTTPALNQGPPLHSEGPSSTSSAFCHSFSARGGGERTAAWRLYILCFAVLTTRERDIEITRWPQRDSCFLSANVRKMRMWLRECSNACICVYVCIYVCVSVWVYVCVDVCVYACGVKRSGAPQTPKSWRGFILSFTLSLLFSVVLCCLVVFVMKKIVYLSVTYHVCIWGAKYLNTHSVLAIGNLVYSIMLL